MPIINPATEGITYCSGSSAATWYVNNNQLISFTKAQLTNGTRYTRTVLQGTPQKLIWDGGGTGKEHTIRNPTNYSYSFVPKPYNGGYIIVNANNPNQYLTHAGSSHPYVFWGSGSTWVTDSSGRISSGGHRLSVNLFNESVQYIYRRVNFPLNDPRYLSFTPSQIDGLSAVNVSANNYIYYNNVSPVTRSTMRLSTLHSYWISVVDGGLTYSYDIIDRNSVQTISNTGAIRYSFIAGSTTLNQQYQTNQNISLMCGVDCPDGTCVKCRDGDYVCCYGDMGTVIDRVYDPLKEISDAC